MVPISELVLTECVQNERIHVQSWVIRKVIVEGISYKLILLEFYFNLFPCIYVSINENRRTLQLTMSSASMELGES